MRGLQSQICNLQSEKAPCLHPYNVNGTVGRHLLHIWHFQAHSCRPGFALAPVASVTVPGLGTSNESALIRARRSIGTRKGIGRTSPGCGLFLILASRVADDKSTRSARSPKACHPSGFG